MKTTCRVNRAAQGLFYSGIIHGEHKRRYTFVYDCGTDKPQFAGNMTILKNSINQFKAHIGKTLDLLFISHFHYDHISGIPELLNGIKVDTVVMPYIDDIQRLIYMASFDKELTDDEFALLENPARYFAERGASTIIVVGSPESEDDDKPNNTNIIPPGGEYFKLFSPHDERARISEIVDETGKIRRLCYSYHYSKDVVLQIRYGWEFCIFSDPTAINLLSDLRSDMHKLTGGDISGFLSNCKYKSLQAIKAIYEGASGKLKINQHSVLIISRPLNTDFPRSSLSFFVADGNYLRASSCTSVLLGDIPFDKSPKAIEFLQDNLNDGEVLTVLLPHHGSNEGLNTHAMSAFEKVLLFIASFGEKRVKGRKHPHTEHLSKTIGRAFCLVPVSDSVYFHYMIIQENEDGSY